MSPVSLPLPSARVLMETRIPGGPHIKTRGIAALGFQTNITHFLCCLRDRGHGSLSPEDLPPLSPSTGPPPHPTGAAKSKCQSRRRRCIPSKGQLVLATGGSVACLSQNIGEHLKKISPDRPFPVTDLFPRCGKKKQNETKKPPKTFPAGNFSSPFEILLYDDSSVTLPSMF